MRKLIKLLYLIIFIILLGFTCIAGYGYLKMVGPTPVTKISYQQSQKLRQESKKRIANAEYDSRKINSVGIEEYLKAQKKRAETLNQNAIGTLEISSINLQLPVLAGMSEMNLLTGASTLKQSQKMGQGNYVLMSHNLVAGRALLHNIDKIKSGSEIYLTDWQNIYVYTVDFNKVVYETEVDYLDDVDADETPVLTLFRCEGGFNTPYRRLVQAKLARKMTANAKNLKHFGVTSAGDEKYSGLDGLTLYSMMVANFYIRHAAPIIITILVIFGGMIFVELYRYRKNK